MKLTADIDLRNLFAKDIESFRYLAYSLERDKKEKQAYVDIFDYNALANQEKKYAVIIKFGDKRIKFSLVSGTRFFAPFHLHMNGSKNMLKNLKFFDKKVSSPLNVQGCLDFYVYEYEMRNITATLSKDNFVLHKKKKKKMTA